jgi:hypothetical protein
MLTSRNLSHRLDGGSGRSGGCVVIASSSLVLLYSERRPLIGYWAFELHEPLYHTARRLAKVLLKKVRPTSPGTNSLFVLRHPLTPPKKRVNITS